MKRIQQVATSTEWPDDVLQLCSDNPFYFIPFRAYIILTNNNKLHSAPVPYIHRVWFLPLILAYVCWKRVVGILTGVAPQLSGHVFCCSSASGYRTEAFFQLLDQFRDNSADTTMFTVSDAAENFRQQYDTEGISIVTFGDCFTTVSPLVVGRALGSLWRIAGEMAELLEMDNLQYRIIAFNSLVVEFIKYRAIDNTAEGIDSFHTFAPMPYQLKAVDNEKIYCYQHGIGDHSEGRSMANPKYAPISYVTWGAHWTDMFEQQTHAASAIYPAGSPRYDSLAAERGTHNHDIDLLFISGSHTLSREDADEDAYRELVEMVVDVCAEHDWNLVIKLHPIEGPERYEQWGYDEYITDETDIVALLRRSAVAVTDLSSAFIESICVGTPVVVTRASTDFDMGPPIEMNGLSFPDTLAEARADIERTKGTLVAIDDVTESGFINLNDSCEEIYRIVTEPQTHSESAAGYI